MRRFSWMIVLLFPLTIGCASRPLPVVAYPRAIYPINHYPISAKSGGLSIAAIPFAAGRDVYADPEKSDNPRVKPPIDVLQAGVLPVRLILSNQTGHEIALEPDQILGAAGEVVYRPYTPQEAIDLVIHSDAFKQAIKGSQVGPVLKSILGGEILLEAVKGGVGGVASGGITGGASGAAKGVSGVGLERAQGYEKALIELITREYAGQALPRKTLRPGYIADGLIFFSSQAGITEIRIQAYDLTEKRAVPLNLKIRQ